MSSSPQSSRTSSKRTTGRCPTCGGSRIAQVVEDVVVRVGRRSYRFEQIPHERCRSCGERIFGIDASKQFDATVLKGRRRAA